MNPNVQGGARDALAAIFNQRLNEGADPGLAGYPAPQAPVHQGGREWGTACVQAIGNIIIEAGQVFSRCLAVKDHGSHASVLGVPELNNPTTRDNIGFIFMLASGLNATHDKDGVEWLFTQVVYQAFAPYLPDEAFPDEGPWTAEIQNVAAMLLADTGRCSSSLIRDLQGHWEANTRDGAPQPGPHNRLGVHDNIGQHEGQARQLSTINLPVGFAVTANQIPLGSAVLIIRILGEGIHDSATLYANLFTHFVISAAKRGNITNSKLKAILREVDKACDLQLDAEPRAVEMIFRVLQPRLTAHNTQGFLERLQDIVGQEPERLRLRLTLTQAACAGLTSIVIIRRALVAFPAFPWAKICELYPQDATAVMNAFNTIGNNAYYGFSADIENIKATRYRNFTWVAKELLIRVEGDATLGDYAGFLSRVKHQEFVRELIETYKDRREAEIRGAAPPASLDAARAVMAHATLSTNLA